MHSDPGSAGFADIEELGSAPSTAGGVKLDCYLTAEISPALINSRFNRAMLAMEISFGHSASHSVSFLQFPKPKISISRTMAKARFAASGFP